MTDKVLTGKLVKLVPINKEKIAEQWANWNIDSDYTRLLDIGPSYLYPRKQIEKWIDEIDDGSCEFAIHAIAEDKVIGDIGIGDFDWAAGTTWVGIGIGDPDFRG